MTVPRPLIAVVDDDPGVRTTLERLLRSAGYLVQQFSTAKAFIDAAVTIGADCIILDILIGGTSGIAVARHPTVAALSRPIIFISGNDDEALRQQALQIERSAFLCKPFRARDLLTAITMLLDRR